MHWVSFQTFIFISDEAPEVAEDEEGEDEEGESSDESD